MLQVDLGSMFNVTRQIIGEMRERGYGRIINVSSVNALAPGYADTPMVEKVPDAIMDNILSQVPVGRLAEPHDVVRCVAFLASEDVGFITGATLSVNGGLYMD